jgi:hypothetical protein
MHTCKIVVHSLYPRAKHGKLIKFRPRTCAVSYVDNVTPVTPRGTRLGCVRLEPKLHVQSQYTQAHDSKVCLK